MKNTTERLKEAVSAALASIRNYAAVSRRKFLLITSAVLVVLIAAVCLKVSLLTGDKGNSAGAGRGGTGGAGQASYTVVRTETPHYGNVYVTSSLTGTVEASDVIHIYAKAAGDVTTVDVQAGDYVEAGQLIMTINTNQVDSAKNSLDSAEVNLNSAENNLNRMKILFSGGDITAQEYESAQNQYKTAELAYNSAKLNYDKQLSYSSITAPISGRIESISAEVYDNVSTNTEIAVISGEGDQKTTVYVSERIMKTLSTGDELKVVKNGKEYSGRITEISTIVDSSTGLFKVKAELENNDEIATGSTVKIILTSDKAENVMLVPVDAIYYSNGKPYLYVVRDGIAHTRFVEVGLYDDEAAEIKDGLSEGDLVVSTWSSNLYEGARVRLYEDLESLGDADSGEVPDKNSEEISTEESRPSKQYPEGGQPSGRDGQRAD